MGCRANYIFIERQEAHISYHHYGGQFIDQTFFWGPDRLLPDLRGMEDGENLLTNAWAEGGALIDADAHLLLLWGGEDVKCEFGLREVWLQLMAISWRGWNVRWPDCGMFDFADRLGIPHGEVRERDPVVGPIPGGDGGALIDWCSCLATIRLPGNSLSDYWLTGAAEAYVGAGMGCVDAVLERATGVLPDEDQWGSSCFFMDIPNRCLTICPWGDFGTYDPVLRPLIVQAWPGWTVELHTRGFGHHIRLTGRDPAPLQQPAEDHVAALRTILTDDYPPDQAVLRELQGLLETADHALWIDALDRDAPGARAAYFEWIVGQWRRQR